MSLWVLLTLCAVVVLGVVLIALGRRGRRINDHPQCTWCGFDLVGVYPGVVTCPECGAGLARKHGPPTARMGVRVRRPVLIGVGVAGVLLPLLPLGVITVAAVTGASVALIHTPPPVPRVCPPTSTISSIDAWLRANQCWITRWPLNLDGSLS